LIDNIQEDCSDIGLTVIEANRLARVRSNWMENCYIEVFVAMALS